MKAALERQLQGWRVDFLFIYGACVADAGRERGGHCPLRNLRFVFLSGGRAGTGVSQLFCKPLAGTLPRCFLWAGLVCRRKTPLWDFGQQCEPAPGPHMASSQA